MLCSHPEKSRGNSDNYAVGDDIFGHYGAGAHHRSAADSHAVENCHIVANPAVIANVNAQSRGAGTPQRLRGVRYKMILCEKSEASTDVAIRTYRDVAGYAEIASRPNISSSANLDPDT